MRRDVPVALIDDGAAIEAATCSPAQFVYLTRDDGSLVGWIDCRVLERGTPLRASVVVVVMASLPVGANVYLMAREFNAMEGPVASSLVLTTALAAVTTPLLLALLGVLPVK